jgi:hypothetical protein
MGPGNGAVAFARLELEELQTRIAGNIPPKTGRKSASS